MTLLRAVSHFSMVVGLVLAVGCNGDDDTTDPPPPAPTCTDGVANQNETDVDCGGVCEPCVRGQACTIDNDCETALVCLGSICVRPTCDDGVQNQDETDLDCGGPNCGGCALGGACLEDSDCLAGTCQGGTCATTGVAMDEATLCAMYYFGTGAGDNMCTQRSLGSAQDYVEGSLEWGCRPGVAGWSWAVAFLTAASESRITVDWTAAEECVSAARQFRYTHSAYVLADHPEWDTIQNVTCNGFYTGAVADGTPCKEDWDCGEGRGCYSDSPGDEDAPNPNGTARCMPLADDGQLCDVEFHPCGKALRCDETSGTCMSKLANGTACEADADCQSGWCDAECTDSPYLEAGEPCASSDDCDGACLACRPSEPGGQAICQTMGADGDYCRDWWDCLDDLGCVDNQCGTVEEGARCGSLNQAVCEAGISCVPPVNCYAFDGDQAGCQDNADFCVFDDYYGYCDPAAGDCTVLPLEGEACLFDLYCAGGSFCDQGSMTCTKLGEDGDACSDMQPCNEDFGYSCAGTCVRFCEYREDCPTDQYCWPGDDTTAPQCMPINLTACSTNDSCPADMYCDLPGKECFKYEVDDVNCDLDSECSFVVEPGACESDDNCVDHVVDTDCTGDTACQWDLLGTCEYPDCMGLDMGTCSGLSWCWWDAANESCYPGCWEYDGLPDDCAAQAGICDYDEGMGWCMNSCGDYENDAGACNGTGVCIYTEDLEPSCFAQDNACSSYADDDFQGCRDNAAHPCVFTGSAYCDRADWEATGACADKIAVGLNCIPDNVESSGPTPSDDAVECVSGYAVQAETELTYKCSVRPSNPVNGCNFVNESTAALINTVFAFGGVWILGRRVRRRKVK